MNEREFYDYVQKNFIVEGTSSHLLHNIIEYVKDQKFTNAEEAHKHLKLLLDGAFGIEEHEIKQYRPHEEE